MNPALQRRIQRYGWDAAAEVYEEAWRANLAPAHAELMSMADIRAGDRVLDIACGTGIVALMAVRRTGSSGSVFATDLSGKMASQAAARARAAGFDNVETARMDAEALEFEDGAFDIVTSALGLMYVPSTDRAIREMKRVLRPGGRAAIAVWGERRNCGWADIFPIVDARVQSEVCPLFFRLGGPGALRGEMSDAGFSAIVEKRISSTMNFADDEFAVRAQLDGGAVALAAKRFSPEVRREVEDAFLASISIYRRGDRPYEVPGEFVVACGRS